MNIIVNQTNNVNKREDINSALISKMYLLSLDSNNTVSFSGYLYSATGYWQQAEYLMNLNNDLYIEIPSSGQYLSFTDSEIERVLLANNIGSDGVGITLGDIQSVNLGTTFSGNTTITSFPEFKYFTASNNSNNLSFLGCTNLTSIDLSNCLRLPSECFKNTGLTEVNLPNLTIMGNGVFTGSNVQKVNISGPITSLESYAFSRCSQLEELNISNTVINLGNNPILDCPNIKRLTGFENVRTWATYSKFDLINVTLTTPFCMNGVTGTLNDSFVKVFRGNSSLHSLYYAGLNKIPSGTGDWYGIPRNSFLGGAYGGGGNFFCKILYFENIASFGAGTFVYGQIDNLVINNSTPPAFDSTDVADQTVSWWSSWGTNLFVMGNRCYIGTLWVPDSAVATYQADPQYSSLTIKGINTKTNGVDYDLPRYRDLAEWDAAEAAAVAQGGHAPVGLIAQYCNNNISVV